MCIRDRLQRVGVAAGQHVGVCVPKFMRRARGQTARKHERDLGGLHGIFIHVEAEELFGRNAAGRADFFKLLLVPVSYTHLDVYKRQQRE